VINEFCRLAKTRSSQRKSLTTFARFAYARRRLDVVRHNRWPSFFKQLPQQMMITTSAAGRRLFRPVYTFSFICQSSRRTRAIYTATIAITSRLLSQLKTFRIHQAQFIWGTLANDTLTAGNIGQNRNDAATRNMHMRSAGAYLWEFPVMTSHLLRQPLQTKSECPACPIGFQKYRISPTAVVNLSISVLHFQTMIS
jgi:hypothetical protein